MVVVDDGIVIRVEEMLEKCEDCSDLLGLG